MWIGWHATDTARHKLYHPDAHAHLLAIDESARPAICAAIEALPAGERVANGR